MNKIPEEIRTVLLKTEQSADISVELGTAPMELIDRGDGAIKALDFGTAALKGARVSIKLKYLECLREVVQKMAPNEAFPILVAGGTKLRFNGSIGLTYDDVEELREHPMFGKFADLKLESILPVPLADMLNYQTDLSGIKARGEDKISELMLKLGNSASKLIQAIDSSVGRSELEIHAFGQNVGHAEVTGFTHGAGQLIAAAFNFVTREKRQL